MSNYRWRPAAEDDARGIWRWIATDSPRAANGVFDQFETISAMLAEHPLTGRGREDLAPGLRSFPAGPYILFFRQAPYGIEIVRILDGRRDIDASFFKD